MFAAITVSLALLLGSNAVHSSQLDEIDASWNQLRLAANVEALQDLLSDDWLLTHSDGRVQDKHSYLQELRVGVRSNQVIKNDDVRVRRYGDVAVVTGTSIQSGLREGVPWTGKFRFTRVWISRDGKWTMVSSHSSRIAE